MRVAVAYHTGYGKTGSLARAVADGVAAVDGATVDLIDVARLDERDWAALDASDAIIFGSPTYFGSLSAEMKCFFESTVDRWVDGPRWKDKLAAGFTNSKTMSGDKLNTLFDLLAFAAQHGMIWVGLDLYPGWHTAAGSPEELNRLGSWVGAMSQANSDEAPSVVPPTSDLTTGEHLGRRVAELAIVFARGRKAVAIAA
ncbi:MAG: flavodoxin family protein [Chloroflexi bacterium]|nr:flavodoxin family protein [Chloroflexota bacterium]